MNVDLLLARLEQMRRDREERLCKINLAENKSHYLALRGEIVGLGDAITLIKEMYDV